MKQVSPADSMDKGSRKTLTAKRVPMNSSELKLNAQEIPGYYLYWMKGTPERIQQALSAGYTFVEDHETLTTTTMLGSSSNQSGNTDLGSRVSRVCGSEVGSDGQPVRLYLMKLSEEFHQEDLKAQDRRSLILAEQLTGKQEGQFSGNSAGGAYGRSFKSNMFTPKNGSL